MEGEYPGRQGAAAEAIIEICTAGDMVFYWIALNIRQVRCSNNTARDHMAYITYKSSPREGYQ